MKVKDTSFKRKFKISFKYLCKKIVNAKGFGSKNKLELF